ncbi:hypothetical protein BJV82DRAFT_607229 [Fennellomyces sp. T-0311]|nr:hypothetical protein BJV82DRAFT_607229 [Fennellomyces sp. T-0311]
MTRAGTPFPEYHLDFDSVKNTFSKVRIAIDQCSYGQAVDLASATICQIQQLVLATVLNHRAYARGMQGKFDEAIDDAQRVINYQPTIAMGYLQLGNLYRMQGKQSRAIDTFETGLRCVSTDNSQYTLMIEGKEAATKQNETRVDFLAKLPLEIVDDIIALLSQEHKSACVDVSTVWRRNVLRCSKAWVALTGDDGTGDDPLSNLLPFIAPHVEHLTVNTSSDYVWQRYLFGMRNRKFSKIQSLDLRESAMKHITMDTITPVRHSLYRLGSTLTKVVLSHSMDQATITISDILFGLSSLKCLVYRAIRKLSDSMGNFPLPIPHDALVDVQLHAETITQDALVPLLQHCSKIRRLVIDGCDANVLDAIDANNCPNLTILGYNTFTMSTPGLDQSDIGPGYSGLEKFFTMNRGDRQSVIAILSLIRRNMATLKEIYTNTSARECNDLLATYADLRLEKIEKLVFLSYDATVIQPLLLSSISSSVTLSHLSVSVSYDVPELVNILLGIPRLASLSLSNIWNAAAPAKLVELFETYAMDNQSTRAFTSIRLRHCASVTDDVLVALSQIHSLKNIVLIGLRNVSANGIDSFFRSLSGKSTTYISLGELDIITDDRITTLSDVKSLRCIHMDGLSYMTNQGIITMVDQIPLLSSLTLDTCSLITESAIQYAKRKVRNVIVNTL